MRRTSNQRGLRLAHCGKFLDARKRTLAPVSGGVPYSRRGWAGFADHKESTALQKKLAERGSAGDALELTFSSDN